MFFFKVRDKFLDQYKINDEYCRLHFNATYSITEQVEIKICTCSESETEEEVYKIYITVAFPEFDCSISS
jgi:predicted GH43/DUF377 family glycosyl hydrolase